MISLLDFYKKRFFLIFFTYFFIYFKYYIIAIALINIYVKFFPQYFIFFLVSYILFFISFQILLNSLFFNLIAKYLISGLLKNNKIFEVLIMLLLVFSFYYSKISILLFCGIIIPIYFTVIIALQYSITSYKKSYFFTSNFNNFIKLLAGSISIIFGNFLCFYIYNNIIAICIMLLLVFIDIKIIFFSKKINTIKEISHFNYWKTAILIGKDTNLRIIIAMVILAITYYLIIVVLIMYFFPLIIKLKINYQVHKLLSIVFPIGVIIGYLLFDKKILKKTANTNYLFLLTLLLVGLNISYSFIIDRLLYLDYHDNILFATFNNSFLCLLLIIDGILISIFATIYIIFLFLILQRYSKTKNISQIIVITNLGSSLFLGLFLLTSVILFNQFHSLVLLSSIFSILNLIIVFFLSKKLFQRLIPFKIWQLFFKLILGLLYNIEVKGLKNFYKTGNKTIIVSNHFSYIDPPIIATYMPSYTMFAINSRISKLWWVRPFLSIIKTFSIDPNSPLAIREIINQINQGNKIVIFPEGRTSATGSLMKIYQGPAIIAHTTKADILPVYIDGTQFTIFSKIRKIMNGSFSIRPKIKITILSPIKINHDSTLDKKVIREYLTKSLYDVMTKLIIAGSNNNTTLFSQLINSAKTYSINSNIVQDIYYKNISYRFLINRSFLLGKIIISNKKYNNNKFIGLMMPTIADSNIIFWAFQAVGLIPVIIDIAIGVMLILQCCEKANINTIYTSKDFIKKLNQSNLINHLKMHKINVVFLEDFQSLFTLKNKIINFILATLFPTIYYNYICLDQNSDKTAVVLITVGVQGLAKLVYLSHNNILYNKSQILSCIDINRRDIIFNAFPISSCIGLMYMILSNLAGVKTYLYPSPMHYKIIPELVYYIGATILLGNNIWLREYVSFANSYDFYTLRYVIAAGNKLTSYTSQLWFEKFGVRIFNSYSLTEASAVIAMNTPMYNKKETVGRLMPNIDYYLCPVSGVNNNYGKLYIKGPNIAVEENGVKTKSKWYDTGDIVSVDNEGYITILDHFTRFIKVDDRVIFLYILESIVDYIDPTSDNIALLISTTPAVPESTNQNIILVTTNNSLHLTDINLAIKRLSLSKFYTPKRIIHLKKIPLLSNGQFDYYTLTKLVKNYCSL